MKRWIAAVLAAVLAISAAGCGAQSTPQSTATPETSPTAEPTATPAAGFTGNPLTGEQGDYSGKRPVAIQLRTGAGAQPQWGVATADVLIEGVTEGKQAGLMALFADADKISKAGPVAPGRDLMLQFALPLNAVPVHIDKNRYASNLLNLLSYQDLDGYNIGTAAFGFDLDRQASGSNEEDCWYTTADLIRAGLENYSTSAAGDTVGLFRFGERPDPESQNGRDLFLTFSSEDTEELVYGPEIGKYYKNNADGSPMMDSDAGEQATFTNVFVLYASSGIKDDGYTRQYDLAAGGKGLYLTKGGWQEIAWQKGDATAPLSLSQPDGSALIVNPGKSFIAIWGGYYGQGLRLLDADGNEQTLPEKPALLASGISDEAASAAEQEYKTQQEQVAASEAALADSASAAASKDASSDADS